MLAIPGFVGSALDPLVGALGDTPRRRLVLLAGGIGFAVSAALSAVAVGFWTLLVALVIGNPATGAFVSLAQATLMDADPERRDRNMARWTLAGSFGYVGGPAVLVAALWIGVGWRGALAGLAAAAVPLALATRRFPLPPHADGVSLRASLRALLPAIRRREVLRWLAVLEGADFLGDVFHGFLALYLVATGASFAGAALGVAAWTGAGLVGDALLLVVLRRFDALRYLRATAVLALVAYPAFLLVPGFGGQLALAAVLGLLNSGWYAIPKARLYASLPGQSGAAVAVGGVAGLVGSVVPAALGAIAGAAGLDLMMWLLLAAPVVLLVAVPRTSAS